ncbi:MAG: FG-GAP repeat protein [Caldilineaceae bacterium]
MKQLLSLKHLAVISTLLGLSLYGTLHFAAAQQGESDLTLYSRIQSCVETAALPPTLFQPAQSFALAEQPMAEAVGIGDFNHDGRQDVAVAAMVCSTW